MNTRRVKTIRAIGLSTVLLTAGCSTVNEDSVDAVRLSPEQVKARLDRGSDRYLIVDARPETAFKASRLPGATRMDPSELNPNDPDPRFGAFRGIIVYGEDPTPGRANALTKRFLQAGLDVNLLDGGFAAWRERGYTVEEDSK